MPKFFVYDVQGDTAKVVDDDGNLSDVPVTQLPKGTQAGQDFDMAGNTRPPSSIAPEGEGLPADGTTGAPHIRPGDNDKMDILPEVAPGNVPVLEQQAKAAPTGPAARQQYAMQKVVSMGWSPEQAAGVVGRFMQEAYPDLRTGAIGDKGISMGIGQWNKDRRAALVNFAKENKADPLSLDTQLEFWNHEIRTSPNEKTAFETLSHAKSYEDASEAMMHYERPRGYTRANPAAGHGFDNTVNNAYSVLQAYDPDAKIELPDIKGGGNTSFAGLDKMIGDDEDPEAPGDEIAAADTNTFTPPDLSSLTNIDASEDNQRSAAGRQRIADIMAQGQIAPVLPSGSSFGDIFGQG